MSERITGIYQIRCTKTRKFYIGQSKDIYKRWKQHLKDLAENDHSNTYLQRDFNKYGEKAFRFSILETCPEFRLDSREAVWIKRKGSYNILKPKSGMLAHIEDYWNWIKIIFVTCALIWFVMHI